MSPRISIILPASQAAATIGAAVQSIRAQTFSDWELIVLDDGSTDDTAEVVAAMAREDPRLRLLRRPRAGLVATLNAGVAAARGELIARMDADDESHPERLAEQCALLESQPGVGLASCLVEFGGDRSASAGYGVHVDWINSLRSPEAIALHRFVESPLAHPTVMFRRDVLERHGGYASGDFPEDYELWLRWIDGGVRMAKVPRTLLRWNDSAGRLSRIDERYSSDAFFRTKARWIAAELTRSAGGRAIWVWGAGRPTRKRAAHLSSHGIAVAGYVDVDPKKTTPALGGRGAPVVAPAGLPPASSAFVLAYVSNRGARDQIQAALTARRYMPGRDFLLCA